MSIELNIYLLYWYFQQNQCLNIKKHALHNIHIIELNIHRLAWPLCSWGPRTTACPYIKMTLNIIITCWNTCSTQSEYNVKTQL